METLSFKIFILGVVLLPTTVGSLLCLIGPSSRPTSRSLLLFVGPTSRRRWPSLGDVRLSLFGPRFTDGLMLVVKIYFALPIKSEKQNAAEAMVPDLLKFFKTLLNL